MCVCVRERERERERKRGSIGAKGENRPMCRRKERWEMCGRVHDGVRSIITVLGKIPGKSWRVRTVQRKGATSCVQERRHTNLKIVRVKLRSTMG